jgi:hypothetical protein
MISRAGTSPRPPKRAHAVDHEFPDGRGDHLGDNPGVSHLWNFFNVSASCA